MAVQTERGIPLSAVCPKFLHSNSTSHTGPFSAIAELIDNAYDPDVNAKHIWIDKSFIKDQDCLILMDDGKGMDYDEMHKMLSFGFSDKQAVKGHVPIGLYGNGFKSGSMRLGKDAIVFSKIANTMCVGLLSQTYLEEIKAQNIIVPIVKFTNIGETASVGQEYDSCLHDILTYSLFNNKEELLTEFSAIDGQYGTNSTGTRIIIWNLRRALSGALEVDFEKDRYDIQIPVETNETNNGTCENSLRVYSSILYLKPKLQIIIRGQKVKSQLVSKSLARTFKDTYKPNFSVLKITFGYNTQSKDQYGLMMYHKNRLIKAYEHVACQRKASKTGVGVIGVLECNYLKPMHNKQDFEKNEEYRKTIQNVSNKLEEYWKEVCYRQKDHSGVPAEESVEQPDQNWAQCDECSRWRKLPDGIDPKRLPDKWYCKMNPDPQFRSCTVPEELEDSDDEQPSRYQKTYKQEEKIQKLQKEMNRQQSFSQGTPNTPSHRQAEIRSPHTSTPSTISARKKRAPGPSGESSKKKRVRIIDLLDSSASESLSKASSNYCSLMHTTNPDDNQAASHNDNETVDVDDNDEIMTVNTQLPATGTIGMTNINVACNVNTEELGKHMEHGESDTFVSMETTAEALLSVSAKEIGTQTQKIMAVKQEETDSDGRLKETLGNDGDNHSESEDRPSLERSQEKMAQSLEEDNHEINKTQTHDTTSDVELSHREMLDDLSEGGPTSVKLENSVLNVLEAQEIPAVVKREQNESYSELLLLRTQVEELRSQLLELNQSKLKKERIVDTMQTSPEEAENYKVLYLQAKEEIGHLQEELRELKLEKEENARKAQQASVECDEELACQTDLLLTQIDQGNQKLEELQNKVDNLKNEKCALLISCESLKEDLEKLQRESQKIRTEDQGVQTDVPTSSHEREEALNSILIEIRQKVAHLLVTFIPDLDLQQVNYDCSVIDEILTQVVDEISPEHAAFS